jgi:hypothetical protein
MAPKLIVAANSQKTSAVAEEFFTQIVIQARHKRPLSDEHFTVDGTLVEGPGRTEDFSAQRF